MSKDQAQFTGISKSYKALELKLPQCYQVAGMNGSKMFGSKIFSENCVTVGFFPNNRHT
jgi:hypothetical protein